MNGFESGTGCSKKPLEFIEGREGGKWSKLCFWKISGVTYSEWRRQPGETRNRLAVVWPRSNEDKSGGDIRGQEGGICKRCYKGERTDLGPRLDRKGEK